MTFNREEIRRSLLVSAGALALVALAYAPSLKGPYLFGDDIDYVCGNTLLQNLPLSEWWRIFISRTNPVEYLPLRDLSYKLDMAVGGMNPMGFRIHNLALYLLCCVAVWSCARGLHEAFRAPGPPVDGAGGRSSAWFAAVVTILFAAHPAHVESVAWISGRKDLLSGFFALLTLGFFVKGLSVEARRWAWMAASYGAFLAAILSKSVVVTLPLVALLVMWALPGETGWRRFLSRRTGWVVPLFVLSGVSVALQLIFSISARGHAVAAMTVMERIGLVFKIIAHLAGIAAMPVHLRIIYDVEHSGWVVVAVGALLAGVMAAAGVYALRRRSLPAAGVAAAGLLVIPYLQVIPFVTWSYASDRFIFLALFGLALSLAWLVVGIRPAGRIVVVGILFAAGAVMTFSRAGEWRAPDTVLASTVKYSGGREDVAMMYFDEVIVPRKDYDTARALLANVRHITPLERNFFLQYITAKQAQSRNDQETIRGIAPWLIRIAETQGRHPWRREISNMLYEAGLYSEAERAYRLLIGNYPDLHKVHYDLGLTLAKQGRHAEAAIEMQTAVERGGATAEMMNSLALAWKNAGQYEKAEASCLKAMELDPKYWHAAYNLARIRIMAKRPGAEEALATARRLALAAGDSVREIDQVQQLIRR